MGSTDTIIMSGCIICLLLLNTFVFFYNLEPIGQDTFKFTETSVSQFETDVNETGLTQTSSGLKAIFNIGRFFLNLAILLFGWYPSFPTSVNLIVKLGTYVLAIPLFITIIRIIRGN